MRVGVENSARLCLLGFVQCIGRHCLHCFLICYFLLTIFLQGEIGFSYGYLFKQKCLFIASAALVVILIKIHKTYDTTLNLLKIFKCFSIYVFFRIFLVTQEASCFAFPHIGRLCCYILAIAAWEVFANSKPSKCEILISIPPCLYLYLWHFRHYFHTYRWTHAYLTWSDGGTISLSYIFIGFLTLRYLEGNIGLKMVSKLSLFLFNTLYIFFCWIIVNALLHARFNILIFLLCIFIYTCILRKCFSLSWKTFFFATIICLSIWLSYAFYTFKITNRSVFFKDRILCCKNYSWQLSELKTFLLGNLYNSRDAASHNCYLSLATWYGLPALIIYLVSIGYFYWIIFKNRKNLGSFSVSATMSVTFLLISLNGKGNYCAYPCIFFLMFYLEHYFQKKLYLSSKPSHEVPIV